MRKLLASLLLITTVTTSVWADVTRVAVGVSVGDGEHNTLERWFPTADYLSQKIPGHLFVIVFLDREGMSWAVERNELDFIVTNPGQYADLQARYGIAALATMQRAWKGKLYAETSAAIITRADRKDIAWLSQLKGKSFMAVGRDTFSGFQLAWWELKSHNVDPFQDFSRLTFSGLPPEEIVNAVRNGSVDAATVRTGVLERMASEGKIDLKELRVLHQSSVPPGFPFLTSTGIYPERPFAKARGTPDELAQRVAEALQSMPANHPAARAGGYAGWTTSLDYQPVHELLKDLHLPPYADADNITPAEIFHQYRRWIIAGIAFLLLSTGFAVYALWMNRRLRLSKEVLQIQFAERTRAEKMLRRSDGALRELHDITATYHLPFEGKAQALLAMGCQQFAMPIGILCRIEGEKYEILEMVSSDDRLGKDGLLCPDDEVCSHTAQSSEPVCFERAPNSECCYRSDSVNYKIEAYLGTRIQVRGETYGTFYFVSPRARCAPFSSTDKEILKLMAQWLGREIERSQAQAQMQKLSSALEQTADAVMIANRAGLIEYVNPAFEKITGYPEDEAVGQNPRILRSGRHNEEFYRRLWETILRGEVFHNIFINRRQDGALYYEEKTITPLKDEQGVVTHFISTGKDVTARKLVEERAAQRQSQLAHVQRVSAMGAMATSLAHELNQPLAAIVNYAQGCIHRLLGGAANTDELLTALGHIASEGNRSGEIIRRLRDFLRKGKPLRTRSDINHIVREAVELANLEARQKNIALRLELSDGLPLVLADAVQIEQVVLNLVHNAIEAIDEAQSSQREVTVRTRPDPKNGVEVIVRDTGPGLPDRSSERVFEPFFTTRSRGMGMGLSISRSIIEAHGHHLQVKPNLGGGTVFHFALPAVEGDRLQ